MASRAGGNYDHLIKLLLIGDSGLLFCDHSRMNVSKFQVDSIYFGVFFNLQVLGKVACCFDFPMMRSQQALSPPLASTLKFEQLIWMDRS